MENNAKNRRSLVMKIRVSQEEKNKLQSFVKKSTDKTVSNYLRKLGLKEPITIRYRNDSADDFLQDMLILTKQLNGIGNNYNQAVHKLHTLDRIPEFRQWILEYAPLHKQVKQSIDEIRERINQLYEQWLQK